MTPANAATAAQRLPAQEVYVGRNGSVRAIEFRKLTWDKDFIWKLEVVLKGRISKVQYSYECSMVLDPTETNEQLKALFNEAKSKQLSLESITGKVFNEMTGLHDEYQNDASLFGIVDFEGAVLKMENKPFNQQLVVIVISNDAAQAISKLMNKLDKAAIVLRAKD